MKIGDHYTRKLQDHEKGVWSCNIEDCTEPADFIIGKCEVDPDDGDTVVNEQGACEEHARKLALKDSCTSCLRLING